jgi:hypothetical protein
MHPRLLGSQLPPRAGPAVTCTEFDVLSKFNFSIVYIVYIEDVTEGEKEYIQAEVEKETSINESFAVIEVLP